MEYTSELRLDKSKVTHIKIIDSVKGIDTGWGVKQYKDCEAIYANILWWRYLNYEAGYWKNGKQYSSCVSPIYDKDEINNNEKYFVQDGWVFTKVKVIVFIGEEAIKFIYFNDMDSAKKYCDFNFSDVNFVI
jgi:hypothetical protein